MINKLKSRKFLMAVAAAILVIVNDGLGLNLPKESITSIVSVVISYILGQSYVDSKTQSDATVNK